MCCRVREEMAVGIVNLLEVDTHWPCLLEITNI